MVTVANLNSKGYDLLPIVKYHITHLYPQYISNTAKMDAMLHNTKIPYADTVLWVREGGILNHIEYCLIAQNNCSQHSIAYKGHILKLTQTYKQPTWIINLFFFK